MSLTSDYLRALADDMDELDDDIGVVIITQEDDDCMLSSNVSQDNTRALLKAVSECLTAPTYH